MLLLAASKAAEVNLIIVSTITITRMLKHTVRTQL